MTGVERAPRRLHRRRVPGAQLVMVLAGLVGLVLTLGVLRDPGGREGVVVAARALDFGVPLRASDVRVERIDADAQLFRHFIPARDAAGIRGQVLTAPAAVGEPLIADHVRARPAGDARRAMSIPVERARAVNGRLARGDRVDVVLARDGIASVVAADLEVLDVEDEGDGAFAASRGQVTITLAVDVEQSQRLAAVVADGDFVLTRVTGAASAAGQPPVVVDELVHAR